MFFDTKYQPMRRRAVPSAPALLLNTSHVKPRHRDTDPFPHAHRAESLITAAMISLISDLRRRPAPRSPRRCQHFRLPATNSIVFHGLDHDEVNFPFDTMTEFTAAKPSSRHSSPAVR